MFAIVCGLSVTFLLFSFNFYLSRFVQTIGCSWFGVSTKAPRIKNRNLIRFVYFAAVVLTNVRARHRFVQSAATARDVFYVGDSLLACGFNLMSPMSLGACFARGVEFKLFVQEKLLVWSLAACPRSLTRRQACCSSRS